MKQKRALFQNPMNFFWWLRFPLFWWVKVRILSEDQIAKQGLGKDRPILFVLAHRSFSDFLVLYHCCKQLGLPAPRFAIKNLKNPGQAASMYLNKVGLIQVKRTGAPPSPLQKLCKRLETQPDTNVDIVPVSVLWGRNPGKQERSLFKLLFPDDEHAGLLQKIFIVLAQGRGTVVHFGTKIDLREQVDTGPNAEQVARKIRRVLRVHFQRQRTITLGPKAYEPARVIRFVFDAPAVQLAIDQELKKNGGTRAKIEARVRGYLREIAAAHSYSMIRFLDISLSIIWQKIYDGIRVYYSERLRAVANDHEIIYVPSHRSHLDYLLLPYELYHRGLATPHTAAGINLSFWPLGPILRRGGGFFIRRSFKGNRLYTVVFTEYLNYLIVKGHPITYFPEGGRSRTGRLLAPKTGMLAMILRSYLRNPARPLSFVPVYIAYDKVAEAKTYFTELRGVAKKKESAFELLKAWKVLASHHGKAYIGFGDPIFLDHALDQAHPGWRSLKQEDFEKRPRWLVHVIDQLAQSIMRRINEVAIVSPVAMVSLLLIASPQRAIAVGELRKLIDFMRAMIRECYRDGFFNLPEESADDVIAYCERVSPINRFKYPDGEDVIYLNEIDASILVYYRNNIIHLFVIPSLIAKYTISKSSRLEALEAIQLFLPLVSDDFWLPWQQDDINQYAIRLVDFLLETGTAKEKDGCLHPASVQSEHLTSLNFCTRLLGFVWERYALGLMLVHEASKSGGISKEQFEKAIISFVGRLSALSGIADPEVFDLKAARALLDRLKSQDLLYEPEPGKLFTTERIAKYEMHWRRLLDPQIWDGVRMYVEEFHKQA